LADGRVFTGEQAVDNGLVDTLGTYEDAVMITAELAGISGEPSIVKERRRRSFWDGVFGDVGESLSDLKQEILDRPVLSYRYVGPY
ncbi:MAG: S49 family peptidase, partial [Bacteroidota bacterium]